MKKKMQNNRWGIFIVCLSVLAILVPMSVWSTGQKPEEIGEPVEVTWLMRSESGEETVWVLQEAEKKLNVRIIPSGVDPNDGEKVNIMLAGGDFPDCGYLSQPAPSRPKKLYEEGVIRGIPLEMIKKYMPNYTKLINEKFPFGLLLDKNPDNPDELLSIQGIAEMTVGPNYYLAFRVDWAQNVGVELPNYKQERIPLDRFTKSYYFDNDFTLDWFERLLVAFRDDDPDGNGKNDTIPWGGCSNATWTWEGIIGAFGVEFNQNLSVDGELYDYCIAPGYKDFLKLAAKWYEMGLVDQEFPTIDIHKAWDKIASGVIGAAVDHAFYPGFDYATNRPPNNWIKDEEIGKEGAEVVFIPPLVGPAGLQGSTAGISGIGSYPWFVINKKTNDEKLEKILQFLDTYSYGNEENWVYGEFGKPGVHFDWEGEAWNSKPILRDFKDVPAGYPKQGGIKNFYPGGDTFERAKFKMPSHIADFISSHLLTKNMRFASRPYRYDMLGETKLSDIQKIYGDTLNTIRDEFYLKAIVGKVDIDSEWDAYVTKWRNNGGDEVLEETMKAPIVEELLKGKFVY